jgi:undecaprenyl-diphosphatase
MYVKFEVKAVWWIQVIKVIFGLVIAFAIKEGLKFVFPDEIFFDFIRYTLIGVWAALGAPFVFKHVIPHLQKKVS